MSCEDCHWTEVVCMYCCEHSDDERPCGKPECERAAVRAARLRRVRGLREAVERCVGLACRYLSEGGPYDRRAVEVLDVIRSYEAQVADALIAQEREDAETRDTLPAPALTPSDVDSVLAVVLAEDFAAVAS